MFNTKVWMEEENELRWNIQWWFRKVIYSFITFNIMTLLLWSQNDKHLILISTSNKEYTLNCIDFSFSLAFLRICTYTLGLSALRCAQIWISCFISFLRPTFGNMGPNNGTPQTFLAPIFYTPHWFLCSLIQTTMKLISLTCWCDK